MPGPLEEEGSTAGAAGLTRALGAAPPAYLEGALANPALSLEHVLLILRNPAAPGTLIRRLGGNPAWARAYEVRSAIVLHPRTPRALAMNLVGFLRWRDLARVSDHPRLAPPLRHAAERLLTARLQELALGEKVTLARIAGRGVIAALRREEAPTVIQALLQNPRLVEEDALLIATAARVPPGVLQVLAEDDRFAPRPAVRKAIARHPRTPPPVALRLLRSLATSDLREICQAARAPALVKVAARRLIEERRRRPRDGGDAPEASGKA